jgi:hypothetical protein
MKKENILIKLNVRGGFVTSGFQSPNITSLHSLGSETSTFLHLALYLPTS